LEGRAGESEERGKRNEGYVGIRWRRRINENFKEEMIKQSQKERGA